VEAVDYEIAIPFSRAIRGVVRVDPTAPLPPPVIPAVTPPRPTAEQEQEVARAAQARAEQEKRWQVEHEAIQRTLKALTDAVQGLEAQQRQRLGELQRMAIELSVAIASRLVHETLQVGDFAVEALVRKAVAKLEARGVVTVRLNPEDVALLEQRLKGQPLLPENADVHLVADPALARGNCRAEAGDILVTSQWEAQLEEIRQHLLRSVGNANAGPRTAQP
jgi:flagellar assembly protein FliH